ncbi:MAG: Kelch repeat-containing protein, partial [Candidatus Geothermarchaeales archaeon]
MQKWVPALLLALLLAGVVVYAFLARPPTGEVPKEKEAWQQRASMPTPRTEVVSVVVGGEIYVLGGLTKDGTISDDVEVYDPVDDSWRVGPRLPVPLHHAGATAHGGGIYVVGGYHPGGLGRWTPSAMVFVLDLSEATWERRRDMPTARGALTVRAVGGLIYAFGGADGSRAVSTAEVYDPVRDSWAELTPMSTRRDHLASAVVGGKIYVIGGRDLDPNLNLGANEEYDPATDAWRSRTDMPTPRGGIAAAVLEGRIYVFGGETRSTTFPQVEEYDPSSDSWRRMADMPTPRHGLAASAVGDRIYVIGGGPQAGLTTTGVNEAFSPTSSSSSLATVSAPE